MSTSVYTHPFWGQTNKRFSTIIKSTRRNKIRKIIREIYLRDDISCGVDICTQCNHQTGGLNLHTNQTLIIVDIPVASHHIDFLTDANKLDACVLLSTVMNSIREDNIQKYNRLRNLVKKTQSEDEIQNENFRSQFYVFPNEFFKSTYIEQIAEENLADRHKRSVLQAAIWYTHHLKEASINVIFLTHEIKRKEQAINSGLTAMTIYEYAEQNIDRFDKLIDKLALPPIEDDQITEENDLHTKENFYFDEHWSIEMIEQGLQDKTIFSGILRTSRKSCYFGNITTPEIVGDVCIKGSQNLNRAIDGDLVVFQILSSNGEQISEDFERNEDGIIQDDQIMITSTNQKVGKIVGILKRSRYEFSGTIKPLEDDLDHTHTHLYQKQRRLFIPVDTRIPFIYIKSRFSKQIENRRISVVIDRWPKTGRFPEGHWTTILGQFGDTHIENSIILKQFGVLTHDFSMDVLRCLPPSNWMIPEEEITKRLDMRNEIVCSIDPPGCKDIDDALSLQTLPNGNYLIGIHIADVTHFVKPDTAIDIEAAARSTTVYLVDRRTDMLPSLLTTDLCSLVSGTDRLAFTAFVELNSEANIISTDFKKTVIRSCASLTYAQAQSIIDNKNDHTQLAQNIRKLNELAKKLRAKRFEKGALELASIEVKFNFDTELQEPGDLEIYETKETNKLIEEYMLLANSSVATHILKKFPHYSILRKHPPPKNEELQALKELLDKQGMSDFNFGSSKELNDSLNKFSIRKDSMIGRIIKIMTTRCMNQALYFCTGKENANNFFHYGLAATLYTHFTSPIRRYADVLVHRLLTASIGLEPLPHQLTLMDKIDRQTEVMNMRHRNAQWAGRASVDFFSYLYLQKLGIQEEPAIVLVIRKNGMRVLIPRFGLEGLVDVSKLSSEYDAKSSTISFIENNQKTTLTALEAIIVKIEANDKEFRNRINLQFVRKSDPEALKSLSEKSSSQFRKELIETNAPTI